MILGSNHAIDRDARERFAVSGARHRGRSPDRRRSCERVGG